MTKRERWLEEVARWRESGKTQAEYCRERNLSVRTFAYYMSVERAGSVKGEFIELRRGGTEGYVEVYYGEALRIRLPLDVSAERIAELVRCLA